MTRRKRIKTMALFFAYRGESCLLAVWKMDESVETLLRLLPRSLRMNYEKAVGRFASVQRRQEWLSVRVLLFTLLGEDKIIAYHSDGKPYLEDGSYSISVSHTVGYASVIVGDGKRVGVDIERYGRRIHRITDRFIRPDELVFPYRADITWGLLLHWSAKETVYKCMDRPDADLRSLRLSPFLPEAGGRFQVSGHTEGGEALFRIAYLIHPDFVLTWTVL